MSLSSKVATSTFSVHETLKVAAPVSGLWLRMVHAIKVIIRDGQVLGIAGNVNDLPRKKQKVNNIKNVKHNDIPTFVKGLKF